MLRRVVVFNAGSDAEPGRSLNFIVGGNILGRGVTIENLLVTYYLREPKIGQMEYPLHDPRLAALIWTGHLLVHDKQRGVDESGR